MKNNKAKVILDSNIWISFAIGKYLGKLKEILYKPTFDIYVCEEIILEVNDVLQRNKFKKCLKPACIKELNEIILATTIMESY